MNISTTLNARKILFIAFAILITISSNAQTDLYTALQKNGPDTKYQEYNASLQENGKYKLSQYFNDKFVLEIDKIATGEYVGFSLSWEVKPTNGGSYRSGGNVLSKYVRAPNYPDVSFIYDGKDGYVAMDGNIYKLADISADGLSFRRIKTIYILENNVTEPAKGEKKEKKKLSFKEKMKALKDASMKSSSGGGSLSKEAKAIQNRDIRTEITTYLKEMKAKYDKHSSSPSVIQAQKNIKNARDKKAADHKAYIDSTKANPEYQRAVKAHFARKETSSSASKYTIKNTTGKSIKVGNGSGSSYQLSNGSTYKVNCSSPIYIMKLNGSGTTWEKSTMISDGKNVCGKTISF